MEGQNGSCNCNCGGCKGGICNNGLTGGWCHGLGHHWLLRLILGLVVLAIVFKVGYKVGEFKGEFVGSHPWRNMPSQNYGYGEMMGGSAFNSLSNFGF